MREIIFVSGKGGTGKSTLVATLSRLVEGKMLADCDVDAPNLHLIVDGPDIFEQDFSGATQAFIDPEKCLRCGRCVQTCRFDAIDAGYHVLPMACEGCGACILVCPCNAITLCDVRTGVCVVSDTQYGTFSHAQLNSGAEGSGKLVTQVRKNLQQFHDREPIALVDGSPGIGCAVIASITGADAVVAVAEATLSGQSDVRRVLETAKHFGVPAYVVINKYDLNLDVTDNIEKLVQEMGCPVLGKIPFEPDIVRALQQGQTPLEYGITPIVQSIQQIWDGLMQHLQTDENKDIQ